MKYMILFLYLKELKTCTKKVPIMEDGKINSKEIFKIGVL